MRLAGSPSAVEPAKSIASTGLSQPKLSDTGLPSSDNHTSSTVSTIDPVDIAGNIIMVSSRSGPLTS